MIPEGITMSNADVFLELYRDLEELLEVKYSDGRPFAGSAVIRYYNDDESRRWREELNACREMRNMLSHHSKIGGVPVFEPSDAVIEVLRKIINDVKNPPVAMTIATPANNLLVCGYSDKALDVIRKMREQGFSHVPVIEKNKLVGVFSVGTVFAVIAKYGAWKLTDGTEIRDFADFLPIDKHVTEKFGFVADSASYNSLKNKFNAKGPKSRRVAALFVTANGRQDEKILGIITPWDMIKEK